MPFVGPCCCLIPLPWPEIVKVVQEECASLAPGVTLAWAGPQSSSNPSPQSRELHQGWNTSTQWTGECHAGVLWMTCFVRRGEQRCRNNKDIWERFLTLKKGSFFFSNTLPNIYSQFLLQVGKLMIATFAHSGKPILTSQGTEKYGVICSFEDIYALTHTIKIRQFSCFRKYVLFWIPAVYALEMFNVKGLQ